MSAEMRPADAVGGGVTPRRSRWWRVGQTLAVLLGLVVVIVALVLWSTLPAEPDAFYAAPADLPAEPGTFLRSEAFTRGVPDDARAWRMLYTTTRGDGSPTVASAIVLTSSQPPTEPRPVIAWAHGTTGVAEGCAPSILDEPFENLPALDAIVANGWVLVATDYAGLGTAGPHGYLIGEDEARSTLDAVRAARHFSEVRLDERTVVWGHSQGGHAALWTGILAPDYAPDVQLSGVAALSPASDLMALLEEVQDTVPGRVIASYVLTAWSEIYPEITFNDVVRPGARVLTSDIARRCLAGRAVIVSGIQAIILRGTIVDIDPTEGAMTERILENIPTGPIDAPLIIGQGLTDGVVLPSVQEGYVRARCEAGQSLQYWTYAGQGHLEVVAPDSPLNADLVRWTEERFAGVPQAEGCHTTAR